MNMTITESDKKLISFLAAFLIAIVFIFLVFKPLSERNSSLKEEINEARQQEYTMGILAARAEEMAAEEVAVREQMNQVLQRFYPMLQSQEAENMATVLMLNHGLQIQNVSVTIPENVSSLQWYQYSENAQNDISEEDSGGDGTDVSNGFGVYTARVTCIVDGDKSDLTAFVDDISSNYPAISILSLEWSVVEKTVSVVDQEAESTDEDETEEEGEAVRNVVPVTTTQQKTGLTIALEIYMCNQ